MWKPHPVNPIAGRTQPQRDVLSNPPASNSKPEKLPHSATAPNHLMVLSPSPTIEHRIFSLLNVFRCNPFKDTNQDPLDDERRIVALSSNLFNSFPTRTMALNPQANIASLARLMSFKHDNITNHNEMFVMVTNLQSFLNGSGNLIPGISLPSTSSGYVLFDGDQAGCEFLGSSYSPC